MNADGRDHVIAWRLDTFPSLPSTSDYCIEHAARGEPEGLAVLALAQTSGRGSRGRSWTSPVGNLHLSVLLRPQEQASALSGWALLAALALADALGAELPERSALTLKWPNDVMLRGRKTGGILIDSAISAGRAIDWLVIGFGANLAAAPQFPDRTTSALGELGVWADPRLVAAELLRALHRWRATLISCGMPAVRDAWLARAHPIGTEMRLAVGGAIHAGRFAGLDADCGLLLQTERGVQRFGTGDVLLQPAL
jgi:BirA family biotin operon repressor/biotin-[acetyl-CoA-carboxylase] ligase